MSEIIIVNDEPETPAVSPAHEAQMEELAAAVEEAQETADAALVAAVVAAAEEPHVCRCGEIEARVIALETAAAVELVEEAEMDAVIAEEIAVVEEPEAPMPPPVKETAPEPEAEEKPAKGKRSGMSKGWFGARAK